MKLSERQSKFEPAIRVVCGEKLPAETRCSVPSAHQAHPVQKPKSQSAKSYPELQLVRPKPAAEILGVSMATFWRLVRSGALTRVKLGRQITGIRLSEIQALIESKTAA